MRVALYARVSTRDRDQHPETQMRPLREWASRGGHVVMGEYVDQASATSGRERHGWAAMVARSDVEAIVVVRVDRAFRHTAAGLFEVDALAQRGVGFIAMAQSFDTTSPLGRAMLTMALVFAELERGILRERVLDGMARARAEGKHTGRPRGAKDRRPRAVRGYYAAAGPKKGKRRIRPSRQVQPRS
jgi:DNA invertase Pin-like site-specific DNA recombinase